jgi:hypothetical protein
MTRAIAAVFGEVRAVASALKWWHWLKAKSLSDLQHVFLHNNHAWASLVFRLSSFGTYQTSGSLKTTLARRIGD